MKAAFTCGVSQAFCLDESTSEGGSLVWLQDQMARASALKVLGALDMVLGRILLVIQELPAADAI